MSNEPLMLSVREVAQRLRISRSKVYELIASEQLPALKFGPKTIRVNRVTLERWLAEQEGQQPSNVVGIDTGYRWR